MLSPRPDTVVTFGDSLSDSGAIYALTDALLIDPLALPPGEPALEPGYDEVFSNGPVQTQVVARQLDAELAGYATGSARAVGTREAGELVPDDLSLLILDPFAPVELSEVDINLGGPVARFLGGAAPFPGGEIPLPGPDTYEMGTLFIGLNDFSAFSAQIVSGAAGPAEALAFVTDLATAAGGAIQTLAGSGLLDGLAVYTLPGLDFFPGAAGQDPADLAQANVLVEQYNQALRDTAGALTGIDTAVVEVGAITAEVDADPATFGFLAKGPYYATDGSFSDVEFDILDGSISLPVNAAVEDIPLRQLQFFDGVHFTEALHGIVGAYAAKAAVSDTTLGGDADEVLRVGTGRDLVLAGAGDDFVGLGRGRDVGLGGIGNDTIVAFGGRDIVSGGAGDDDLVGKRGGDVLAGGAGDDVVRGGLGHDILFDGAGSDVLRGWTGDDSFVWVDPTLTGGATGGTDRFNGGAGQDTLYIVTDAVTATALEAEIAAQEGAPGPLRLDGIGLTARGIEQVVVLGDGIDGLEGIDGRLAGQVDLALDWGFV